MLYEDAGGTLWAATWGSGLARFDPASGTAVNYRVEHILGGLGGLDALVAFVPEQIYLRTEVPPVVISRFLLANQPLAVGGTSPLTTSLNATSAFTLPYSDEMLGFEFVALDYRAPEAVRYQYRLEGFDKSWIETDSAHRSATYTNLAPGSYVFQVKATNGDGVWGQEERSIGVTITPPWWQTWWFIMLVGIASVAGVVGVFRYRLHSLQVRQQQLEREVAVRTGELSAATQAARTAYAELDRQVALERELVTAPDLDSLLGRIRGRRSDAAGV